MEEGEKMSEQELHVRCQECGGMYYTVDKDEADLGICPECRKRVEIEPSGRSFDEFDVEHREDK